MSAESTHHPNYVAVWGVLLVLLIVSVLGPMVGLRAVTILTAFGIALVKAWLVARKFMHISVAKPFVLYLMVISLLFMVVLFFGIAPDVMKDGGQHWHKTEVWTSHSEVTAAPHGGDDEGSHP
ncbi:MAG: cytochrome C oxidase subunit IV family protein [Gemmatimonadota bacterium]|jgi:caa(3)-type oxidase subunit IV|nr:cytochrome C oxidase subunit IV family protein [Gemmatimonadota bacterium]MDP6529359.1 cytochrome C oxidase subunit IV family protein [Gemmatimonadota bacterium]MDP6803336.1 cytochrome C oxidase subunit IV family protein [Gemmatimonadota bacterium]MDP7031482.1 cytochrome C oxidase subunit IV family protein [Gemmatimonadota bacterium]